MTDWFIDPRWLSINLSLFCQTPFPHRTAPKVLQNTGVLHILTCKCVSCHSSMPFFHRNFKNRSAPQAFCHILTWKCASRHSSVPFFISLLNSYLRTRRFSEPTFRTSGTTNHWENTAIRDFPNISRVCIFFLVTLWSSSRVDRLSSDLTSLLCFSTVHIVGS